LETPKVNFWLRLQPLVVTLPAVQLTGSVVPQEVLPITPPASVAAFVQSGRVAGLQPRSTVPPQFGPLICGVQSAPVLLATLRCPGHFPPASRAFMPVLVLQPVVQYEMTSVWQPVSGTQ
jgi:hypothetical protein